MLYKRCNGCGHNWHKLGGPLVHLLFRCKPICDNIRIKDNNGNRIEIPIPKKSWIDPMEGPLIYENDPIFKELKMDMQYIINKLDYMDNKDINSKYWNKYCGPGAGLCDLNWAQLNYAIWSLEKEYNIPLCKDVRYYGTNNTSEYYIYYR